MKGQAYIHTESIFTWFVEADSNFLIFISNLSVTKLQNNM